MTNRTTFSVVLLLAVALLSTESCRPRASKSRASKKQATKPASVAATPGGPSAAQVMSRADSVLAKVNAMSAPELDAATPQPEDYPQSPSAQAGYVPRPDLTAYSNYQAALGAYNAGDFDNAIAQLSQIIVGGNPPELVPNAYYWLGESFYSQGRFADAMQYFEYTTQVGPTYKREMALYKLARCNYAIGNTQAASMWFDRLRAEYPSTKYAKTLKKLGVQ